MLKQFNQTLNNETNNKQFDRTININKSNRAINNSTKNDKKIIKIQ